MLTLETLLEARDKMQNMSRYILTPDEIADLIRTPVMEYDVYFDDKLQKFIPVKKMKRDTLNE